MVVGGAAGDGRGGVDGGDAREAGGGHDRSRAAGGESASDVADEDGCVHQDAVDSQAGAEMFLADPVIDDVAGSYVTDPVAGAAHNRVTF